MLNTLSIAAFSDTHSLHEGLRVPDADVAVFAGDLMTGGWRQDEVASFGEWFSKLPHQYKIVVAGNHDMLFETNPKWCMSNFAPSVIYLRDSYTMIKGLRFYGSPVQPWFHDWAFNVPRGPAIKEYWDKIPMNTDVLITHGPPYGVLDQIQPEVYKPVTSNIVRLPTEHLGCEELAEAIQRVKPKVSIFGHIHGGYGSLNDWPKGLLLPRPKEPYTRFFNCSICDESYAPINRCHLITVPLSEDGLPSSVPESL